MFHLERAAQLLARLPRQRTQMGRADPDDHGHDLSAGARRDDIFDAADFMGWYMQQTVKETGVAINDTRNQYLAYHDGRTGFLRGTWRSKGWLIRISNEVAARAVTYDQQLRSCGKI